MVVLKILSLNIWGLHYIATNVSERVEFIADEIKGYDIIGLQEVWSRRDFAYLEAELKDNLPYSHHFNSGIIGSGLCVFSRYPILSAFSHSFTATDEIRRFKTGEIFAGKGVMGAKISTPQGIVMFYNTHTNPQHQYCQMFEIVQLVDRTRGTNPVILVGDFNITSHTLVYSLITRCLRLRDIYTERYSDRPCNRPRRSKEDTIDFIFTSDELCKSCCLNVQDCYATMCERVPGKDFHFSDHDGVEAVLELCQEENKTPSPPGGMADAIQVYDKVLAKMEERRRTKFTTHHRVVARWAVFLVVNFLLIIFFSIQPFSAFLLRYYLQWLPPTFGIVSGAVTVFIVMHYFTTLKLINALENNINEIRTLRQHLHY